MSVHAKVSDLIRAMRVEGCEVSNTSEELARALALACDDVLKAAASAPEAPADDVEDRFAAIEKRLAALEAAHEPAPATKRRRAADA